MGTTAQKGQRVLQSIEEIQQGINNLGGNLTDQTPFKDFRTELDNIYDNYPKTSFIEGSDITLENCTKGKIDFDDGIVGYGQTSQEIDLTENNLTSQSANDLTITVNSDKSITINGTASANTSINILNNTSNNTPADERTLQPGTYSLTGCPAGSESGTKFKMSVLRSGYVALEDTGSGAVVNITSSQIYTYFRIYIFSGTVCNNLVFRPKLLKIPSSSYPQEVKYVRGRNRLDESTWEIGSIDATTGQNAVGPIEFRTSGYIEVSGTVTLSNYNYLDYTYRGIFEYDSNKNFIKRTNDTVISKTTPFTLNLSLNTRYVRIRYIVGTTVISIPTNMQIQLEEGLTATPYIPYNTIPITLGGINKFNVTDYNNINLSSISGTTVTKASNKITILTTNTINSGFYITNNIWNRYIDNFKSGKAYTLSFDLKSNANTTILAGFEANPENTTLTANTIKRIVTTTSSTSSAIIIYNRNQTADITLEVTNIMISEDSNLTTYEPYYIPITKQLSLGNYKPSKIGNYKDYFYRTSGKNLWHFTSSNFHSNSNTTSTIINENKLQVTSTNTTYANTKFTLSLEGSDNYLPDGQYTFSIGKVTNNNSSMTRQMMTLSTYVNGANRTVIDNIIVGTPKTITITNASNKRYVLEFWGSYDTALVNTATFENIQIEKGNTATDYNPYGSGEWYFKEKMAKVILNSSYRASGGTTGTNAYYIATKLTDGLNDNTIALAYSNMFGPCSFNDRNGAPDSVMLQSGSVTLRTRNNTDIDWSDNTKRDAWLNANSPIVHYVLAIPTDTPIPDGTLKTQLEEIYNIMSVNGTTKLKIDGDLPLVMKVRALKAS